ncbi:DUF4148 domain-containing protein [Burkholderia sp. PR2]|uniref:DUF4148 domain-containing protein n=1 Tax=Burkholderia sp. PR2 TaxID=3448078 RepID=UPI00402A8A86
MKTLLFATLLSALCVALPVRAGTTSAATPRALAAAVPAPTHDAWNAPPAPLTRAQVYRELVRAERDGQLAQLNRELYSH